MKIFFKPLKEKIVFFTIGLLVFLPLVSFAEAVIKWDRNADADYYVVYWGSSSGNYSEGFSPDLPEDTTEIPLEDSTDGKTYYYTVKAFNQCGNSSGFSDEVAAAYLPDSDFRIDYIGIKGGSESSGCFVNSACK